MDDPPPDPPESPPRPRIGTSAWWRSGWSEPLRGAPIPVAAVAAAVVALLAWRLGAVPALPAYAYLGVVGTMLARVDMVLHRLPDPLTLPSYPAGIAALGVAAPFTGDGGAHLLHALAGMAALWVVFAVQWFIAPSAIGLGDVKLSGVLGLYLGWLGVDAWVLGLVAMFVLGGLYGMALLALRRAGRRSLFAFGPFMLAGTLLAVLVAAP